MNNLPARFSGRTLAPCALVLISAIAAVAAYLQALHFPFAIDDTTYVSTNTRLAGLPPAELWRLFTEPYNNLFEFLPLREFSYWLDMSLFGLNPAAFRIHSIILYLLCLPPVYGITATVWRYFRPSDVAGAPWAAAAVTALFALHPSHAEAVVWIAGRKDVLSGMFALLALWFAVGAKREQGFSASCAAAALVALLAAMLSKATAVALAPVIAMIWMRFWLDLPGHRKHRSLLLWPAAVLVLAGLIATTFAALATTKIPLYFGTEAVTRSLAILGWLARLAVSPESRHFFYPVFEDPYLPVMVALGVAVLAAAVAGAVALLRKRSLEAFALVVFLLICMPTLQLIPYAPPSLVSDRFVFLAVWPAVLLLVALAWRLQPVPRAALLLIIALAWGYQTVERPRDWLNQEVLIDADIRAYPGYYVPAAYKITAQLLKGLSRDAIETAGGISDPVPKNVLVGLINSDYLVRASAVENGDPRKAAELLQRVGGLLKHPPEQARWNSPMYQFWETCRTFLLTQWDFLVEHFPGDLSLRYNAGLSSMDVGRYKEAVHYLRAVTESPQLPENVRGAALRSYGVALMKGGYAARAEVPLRAALEQSPPDYRAYCALAELYRQAGRSDEASSADADCRAHGGEG
ncbi:MAG: hypothetical protein HY938_06105 [Nitrosomonadales bacterium]|nr:hypothetical protein [Nitrosomonadales bacterium]